ncbi:MAG: hypothetical protein EZS28_020106 [Streblomastix strix]|uniref:Uncharacterized protein n=1 Tax=Streblomastix strix TaxID=222440 RepID=A0A5J4VP17_9EUKA|nr:MAG: hypothetical protein EZS28_020106 [Streblomastix strix]
MQIQSLKGFTPLGFDSSKCPVINDYTSASKRALISIAAYAYNNTVNIDPSITYAMEALPNDVIKKVKTNNVIQEEKGEVQRNCNPAQNYLEASFEINGVVDSDCVSNEIVLPGHADAPCTSLPPLPTKCDDNITAINKFLTNYKFGYFERAETEDLKEILIRYGPILTEKNEIIFGWGDYIQEESPLKFYTWHVARVIPQQVVADTTTYTDYSIQTSYIFFGSEGISEGSPNGVSGRFIFDGSFLPQPNYCDSIAVTTPKEDCPCPQIGTDEYERDPRHTSDRDICASGSYRAILSVVVVAVVLPVMMLFW